MPENNEHEINLRRRISVASALESYQREAWKLPWRYRNRSIDDGVSKRPISLRISKGHYKLTIPPQPSEELAMFSFCGPVLDRASRGRTLTTRCIDEEGSPSEYTKKRSSESIHFKFATMISSVVKGIVYVVGAYGVTAASKTPIRTKEYVSFVFQDVVFFVQTHIAPPL